MKRILIGLILGLILSMMLGSTALAAGPPLGTKYGKPDTIHIVPGRDPTVIFNQLPNDNRHPMVILIETPQGKEIIPIQP